VALGSVVAQDRENALIDARNRRMVAWLSREIRKDELAAKLARIRVGMRRSYTSVAVVRFSYQGHMSRPEGFCQEEGN